MRAMKLTSLLALGLLVGGCASADDLLPPIDGEFSAIIVYGQVRGPSGAPVPSANVAVTDVRQGACAPSALTRAEAAVTDAAGNYRAIIGNWGQSYSTCVHVQATPPSSAGLAAHSATRSPVVTSTRLDSVRVDLELPRAP
jgi:hypothetical protein